MNSLFFFTNPTNLIVNNNTFSNNFQLTGVFQIIKNFVYDSTYKSTFISYMTVFANNYFNNNLAFSKSASIHFYAEGNINCKNFMLSKNNFLFNGGCFNYAPSLNLQCTNRIETGITTGNKISNILSTLFVDSSMITLSTNQFQSNFALQLSNVYINLDTLIMTEIQFLNNIHLNNGVVFQEYFTSNPLLSMFKTIYPSGTFSVGSLLATNSVPTKTYSSCVMTVNVRKLTFNSDSFIGNFNFLVDPTLFDNSFMSQLIYLKYTITDIVYQLIKDLKNKLVDVIFVYSKRAADQLLKIILNNKIANDLDNCILNCISINVANTLKRLKWKKIKIFSPGEEELSLL